MSDVVIKVENLSKLYRLGEVGTGTLGQDLNRWWAKVRGKEDPYVKVGQINDRGQKAESDFVWSLKDINFEVKQGEVLGIIGKNGAGKSTLLKLISQITSPTIGSIKAKGRIASLLEVGTGMNPELTARENIYLNGAILGMTKREITAKFDEIVDFSGCTMYVDTPVKRYSSGMRVRLGFAVAAFLEPEILIVDEVLAVGDAEFQKKAIGKMKEVSEGGGRTVLFVSHNMPSIIELCSKAMLLEMGQIKQIGNAYEVVTNYLNQFDSSFSDSNSFEDCKQREGNQNVSFVSYKLLNEKGEEIVSAINGESLIVEIECAIKHITEHDKLHVAMQIVNDMDTPIFHFSNEIAHGECFKLSDNSVKVVKIHCKIEDLPLPKGTYYFHLFCSNNYIVFDSINFAGRFNVEEGNFFKTGKTIDKKFGLALAKNSWSLFEN